MVTQGGKVARRQQLEARQRKALVTREIRRTRVAELSLQELTLREIGERLSISHQQAKRDIDHVRSEWRVARLDAFDEYRSRERGRLELVIKEAWAAWYRSLRPHSRKRLETDPIGGDPDPDDPEQKPTPKPLKMIMDEIITEPDGDRGFLDTIRRTSESLRRLDGLDTPVPQEVSGPGGGPIPFVGLIQLVKEMEDLPPPPTDLELITKAIGFDPGSVQLEDEGNGNGLQTEEEIDGDSEAESG